MIRDKLDRIERLFAGTGNYPCDIVEYRGHLDESALADAYAMLCRDYPALSARIVNEESRCEFDPVSNHDDRIRFVNAGDVAFRKEIRELRDQDLDASRLIISRVGDNGNVGRVALCVNHALFDFPSFGFLFERLWEIYTKRHLGEEVSELRPPPQRVTLPLSPEKIITEKWLSEDLSVPEFGISALKGSQLKQIIECTVELSSAETKHLISVARRCSTSVHAFVCAAILMALREQKGHDGEEVMVCRSAVNLRNRVDPNIQEAGTTVLQGFHDAEVKVTPNGSIDRISQDIKEQLRRGIADRSLKMLWEPSRCKPSSSFEKRLSQVMVTNWGVLPKLEQPSDVCVTDRGKIFLDNEYVSWIGKNPIYILSTYEDRLKLIGMYSSSSFTAVETSSVTERISSRLRDVV